MCDFSELCKFCCIAGILPCVCTHTDTEGKQRKASVRNILKSSGKNTIFNEHPVHMPIMLHQERDLKVCEWKIPSVCRPSVTRVCFVSIIFLDLVINVRDLCNVVLTCRWLYDLASDPILWINTRKIETKHSRSLLRQKLWKEGKYTHWSDVLSLTEGRAEVTEGSEVGNMKKSRVVRKNMHDIVCLTSRFSL